MQKVLLFADIGIDDTIALIYSYLSEEIELVGVVADYGNVPRSRAVASVHYLMKLLNLKDQIPIIGGAEVPMTAEQPKFYPEIHGEYGLGPIKPGLYEGIIENFFEIIRLIEKYGDELIIVNIGRLTSLANMFILYQTLMNKVKKIYIMGGAFWVPGNVTAVSEANFHSDPIAVKIVLTYASNLTIIPLNVTDHAIVTPEMVDYIEYKGRSKLVKPLLDYYYGFYKKRNPLIKGSPVHDAITLMSTVNEDMFTFRNLPVHVVTSNTGIHRGQSIADIRPYIQFEEEAKKHRIAFSFEYGAFFERFMNVMTGESFERKKE
ncbi:nucleoside hydrolase [Rossellomorea sp. NPDC071047]|uniref:nucleoside hydrolase n=1 Tax=Rossellomorea sp. NPDC071047 TaxID=3390675 RepID=UPI003D037B23